MKATNEQMSRQLSVKIEDGQLKISIGIALLAFAVQSQDQWPEEYFVSDLRDFGRSMVRQLQREEEDGTTPVHRMLDAAAEEMLEQGDDGADEGSVNKGIKLAKAVLDAKSKLQPHQQRVVHEKLKLDEMHDRLRDFIGRDDFVTIVADENERERLYRQSSIMAEYSKVLGERINGF